MNTNLDINSITLTKWDEIPAGYTAVTGPGGQQFLIPAVMLPSAQQSVDTEQMRATINADHGAPGVSHATAALLSEN